MTVKNSLRDFSIAPPRGIIATRNREQIFRLVVVVIYRYGRLQSAAARDALCEFPSLGVQFISLHEGVDAPTPNGRLMFGIFASIAEFERELIRERVRSGMPSLVPRASG